MTRSEEPQRWTDVLEPEELAFVRRFVLASGSLKEMAEEYGVSYPTIRLRLDGLIEKVRRTTKEKPMSELRRVVRQMVEEGSIDLVYARKLLAAGTKDMKAVQSKDGETR